MANSFLNATQYANVMLLLLKNQLVMGKLVDGKFRNEVTNKNGLRIYVRTRLLDEWYHLHQPTDEAAWWVRKSGAEHYAEHLVRLREWVGELRDRRTT